MSSDVGVALWGVGRHALRRLLPAAMRSRGMRLAGVCTRDEEVGRRVANGLACTYFSSPEEMLADARVDAVIVATPTGLHHQHGLRVIEAGKHLWCEKPLTHSYDTTRHLFDRAADVGVMVLSGLMYKYHPQFHEVKRLVAARVLGELKLLSIRFGMPELGSPTFRDSSAMGGGALLDFSCYALSAVYQLLGSSPVLRCARVSRSSSGGVDSGGWAVLEHGSVAIDAAWGFGRAYRNAIDIWGERGVCRVERAFTKEPEYESDVLCFGERGEQRPPIQTGRADAYCVMLEAFARGVGDAAFQASERREVEWCARLTDEIGGTLLQP